ncbi:hypothetical protein LVD15_12880 [Fulvivirga maritima]|uniref:hypothetical protein n=1 Tax=Fulvivirga maritima TaxID=2904247 RepID=UPI001F3A0BF3|nr:hypothetical protein [Fulvivirga maritima]UII29280.1 hypothetical protein LVD15_12880 [Fulvivirga maritima]
MLEIFAIIFICRKNSEIVKNKGLKPTKYIIFTVVLWILFEVLGMFLGMIVVQNSAAGYIFALLGAALGGFIAYQIAKNAAPADNTQEIDNVLDSGLR